MSFSANSSALATARFDGQFYFFTAPSPDPSLPLDPRTTQTTVFEPITKKLTVRELNIGVRIVGAGQSICVPAPAENVPLNKREIVIQKIE